MEENSENSFGIFLYVKKKTKWYKRIWNFITGNKNSEYEPLGEVRAKPIEEEQK